MLAAGIAHDLNNVLAPIVFAAPLLRDSLSAPRDLKVLNTLEQSAARGTGLVKQILGFAQSTTGQFHTTQVKHLARDIINIIEETFPKTIELCHEVPTDLWPVLGDPTQIHQVLLNLCVNARDAMPHGGTLGIQLTNRWLDAGAASAIPGARPGAWLVVEVTDTGTGIPPEVLARIWDPFFTTKGPGKGTGLGLATVRGIVASHNGFIELQTEVGRGTTFRVFLPVADSGLTCPTSVAPFTVPRGRGELILVVDDDAPIRDSVTEILIRHGYRVTSCADGIDAIAIYATRVGEISLIITDSDMPNLGGESLSRAILGLQSNARIVAMSGLSGGSAGDPDFKSFRETAHAFLAKPFSTEALLGTVHRVLHPSAQADNGALAQITRNRRSLADPRRLDPAILADTTSD
jgi:CheY-like chemotaxis protein